MGFVRHQIEYGAAIWDPRPGVENNGAHKIEMVQRRSARWTLKKYHNISNVSNMLQDLGWRSLEQRRADARLTLLYKIHHGHVPINASKYLRPMTRRSRHSHSDSNIPLISPLISPLVPHLLPNGTVYLSLFLTPMTLLHSNIPSLQSVTVL